MKKFAIIALSALLVLSFAGCKAEKKMEKDEKTPSATDTLPDETPEKEEEPALELNIKPLEETDEESLAAAAESLGFSNTNFFHAFANAIGKDPSEVTQQDVDKVHYVAIGPDVEDGHSVFVGYIDYVDLCMSEAAYEPDFQTKANDLLVKSKFVYDETKSLRDLSNFKNLEMFEIYEVHIDDVSFIEAYDKLIFGYFSTNGITDVSSLADYNPETLLELDFTGNNISDWSYLEHIKEKVFVFYDVNSGISITLDSYLEQQENPAPEITAPEGTGDKNILYDENGNPADFSSLFD